mgnify:CR=1 FL=1
MGPRSGRPHRHPHRQPPYLEGIHRGRPWKLPVTRYVAWHLRKALFFGFGGTIAITAVVLHGLGAVFEHREGHRPPWLAIGIALLALWGASSMLARRLTRPLGALLRAADAFGRGDLSVRVPYVHTRHGEAFVIAKTFNDMAARIERQVADQRALLATVSHEIRSPLARIRLHTELAREADAATTTTHLDAVDDEVAAVDRLVGDLLAGSRIDFGALTRSAHTPAELATSALEAAETPPEVLSVDEDLPELSVDVTLVVRALANLLQNARRHGGGVASFSVAAAGTGTGVSFTVQDRGPGLRSGDEERVFEPFYRSAVREGFAAPDGPSTGLGLALVKRIVEAHGGTVTGQNAPEGGAAFTILLPSTPAV